MNSITPIDMGTTITQQDLSEAVRSTAMLADITISLWSAERSDQKIMDKAKADAGAVGNVGRAVKNLLAGVDGLLKDTRSAFNAARAQHYALTLPWVSNPHAERARGPRLLPNVLFQRYLEEMSKRKREAMVALDKFIVEYPGLVVQAKANLGTLADINYPTPDEVRRSFAVTFDFEPIPASANFVGLPEAMIGKLSKNLVAKQERMVAGAATAMWDALSERVRHLLGRLADKEAIFRDATVENLRDMIDLLPAWNVSGDLRVNEIVADLSGMLGGVTAKQIRANDSVRQDVIEQGTAIIDKLTAWGTGTLQATSDQRGSV